MAEKAKEKVIKGELLLKLKDPHMVRLELSQDKDLIISKRELCLLPEVLPVDYEPELYEVTGSYKFTINVKKK